MPRIVLEVPFATQLGFGDPANPKDDPSGCWYAMARMIGAFFEEGPRLGVPSLYQAGYGVFADGKPTFGHRALWPDTPEERAFMKNEDLVPVAAPSSCRWNAEQLGLLLRKFGPIGFYWIKTLGDKTYGHAAVLIGVDDDKVIFHDPENAPRSVLTLTAFNERLYWDHPNVMVRRKGPAFQATSNLTTFSPAVVKPKPNVRSNMTGPGFLGNLIRDRKP